MRLFISCVYFWQPETMLLLLLLLLVLQVSVAQQRPFAPAQPGQQRKHRQPRCVLSAAALACHKHCGQRMLWLL